MDENGSHLLIDLYTNEEIINDNTKLLYIIKKAVKLSGNKILNICEKIFEPQGYSAVILLAESHASIHTYPEKKYIAIDVYSCGNGEPLKALNFLENTLKPYKINKVLIDRGKELKLYKV